MTLNIIKQIKTICAVIAVVLLFGCAGKSIRAINSAENTPLLVFQKTPCYGTCPSYEARLFTNGQVEFIPWENVPATDTLTFRLTEKEMKKLTKAIADLNYSLLQDLYKTEWTDMPATHLYFYENGKEVKHIKHQEGGPEKLIHFIDETHALLWKQVLAQRK